MEEDELGTQRAIGHVEYVTCSRCGVATPLTSARVVPADALTDKAEFTYLCADCERAMADGEQDLPTTAV